MRTYLLRIILMTGLLIYWGVLPASARNIVLVYDDSQSMGWHGGEKYEYANYAAQTFISLLREKDTFEAILTGEREADHIERNISPDLIRNNWGCKRGTYYLAIEKAMNRLCNTQSSGNILGDIDQDWLIILTDGDFYTFDNDRNNRIIESPATIHSVKKGISDFFDRTGSRVRVVFLLLGNDVDTSMPRWWLAQARDQVEILRAPEVQDLHGAILDIAAKICGRDKQQIKLTPEGNSLIFNSPFPIRRISTLQQGKEEQLAEIESITSMGGTNYRTGLETFRSLSPKGKLNGRITHSRSVGRQILPAGQYAIRTDKKVNPSDIKVLLETAVEFIVELRDKDGRLLIPDKQRSIDICKGEEVEVIVKFISSHTSKPLELTKTNTRSLMVKMWTDPADKKKLQVVNNGSGFSISPGRFVIRPGRNLLSVEASYAGYFHIKRNITVINGKTDCIGPSSLCGDWRLKVPYTSSDTMQQAEGGKHFSAFVIHENPSKRKGRSKDKAIASGIPEGVRIDLIHKGKTYPLTATQPTVTLPPLLHKDEIKIMVFSDSNFQSTSSVPVSIKFEAKSTDHQWLGGLNLELEPVPRQIKINRMKDEWEVSLAKIDKAPHLPVQLEADGVPVSITELEDWKVTVLGEKGVEFEVDRDEKSNKFFITPHYPFNCCFGSAGPVKAKITAKRGQGLETVEATFTFMIFPSTFAETCLPLILKIIAALLALVWLFGIWRKPRFSANSFIIFAIDDPLYPSGGDSKYCPLPTSFVGRYIIPFRPESKSVESMVFRASRYKRRIEFDTKNITEDPVTGRTPVSIAGNPYIPSRKRWQILESNDEMINDLVSFKEKYTYQPGA